MTTTSDTTATVLLEASHISVRFGGVTAADDINLTVRQGEVLGVIGSNGSGKSTFLNLCTGYIRPAAGAIRFRGQPITHLSPRAITRLGIARAFQHPQLFLDKTVLESIVLGVACRNRFWSLRTVFQPDYRRKADTIVDTFGLGDYANIVNSELPEGVKKLSDIALAMALEPSLLLLDEPTSSVSSANKFVIMDTLMPILRDSGVTAIIVEHDMEIVERYMDRVVAWDSGQIIAEGAFADIMHNEDVRQRVTG
ncbi:ABC transporter ATP-binding protein [Castellaniella sp.]|uniref:ABC transporter ATP-binding protein n=1 Tax=Castellaniella sp. TaxID=1955812 RepID=UPI003560D84D